MRLHYAPSARRRNFEQASENSPMGIIDFVKGGVQEMMIARPDAKKHLIVYKHPNQNVPWGAQITVDSDECAVFFKDGKVVGVLPTGRGTLTTQNIPFLNSIITSFTGGNVFIAEIFFVKTQPVRNVKFGGPIGRMIDPLTKEACTPRIHGSFSVVVTDPTRFIIGYVGQAAAGENEEVLDWIKQQFILGVKTVIGEVCLIQKLSVLEVAALTLELTNRFVQRVPSLDDIGIKVLQMGNFDINFDAKDEERITKAQSRIAAAQQDVDIAEAKARARQFELDQNFNNESRYVQQVAGNWQNYAGGRAMIGAGQGMAHGGANVGVAAAGAQMAMGMGMANMMAGMQRPQGPQYPQPNMPAPQGQYGQPQSVPQAVAPVQGAPSTADVACPKCSAMVAPGRFCAECGSPMATPAKKFCTGCGAEVAAAAKFCANCGTPAVQ